MLPGLWNRGTVIPFERLWDIRREMDRLIDSADVGQTQTNGQAMWVPPMDVVEDGDALRCQLEVPGLSVEDLDIRVESNVVTIAGEKKSQQNAPTKEGGFRHYERRYGRFERSFTIPQGIEPDKVSARYDNGVLTVVLPKAERAKPRRVAIESAVSAAAGREIQ